MVTGSGGRAGTGSAARTLEKVMEKVARSGRVSAVRGRSFIFKDSEREKVEVRRLSAN
jgi:hypothetical protein